MSVFFHRAFTHRSITLKPWLRKWVIHTSSWVTGLDLKGWVCMHRMHHAYVDTEKDPHTPVFTGVFSVFLMQHHSLQKTILGLIGRRKTYTAFVEDLEFPVNWLNRRRGLWYLPLIIHFVVAMTVGIVFHVPLLGLCYFVGMLSHPVQGWLVNGVCHRYGYRNYETKDQSKNNTLIGLLINGEGYHNNHHQHPSSAKFSRRWFEFDMGYLICVILQSLNWVQINEATLVRKLSHPKVLIPEALTS